MDNTQADELINQIHALGQDLRAERPTLHDLYTMAALTGYRANPSIIQDGSIGFVIAYAREDADAAMAAREGK